MLKFRIALVALLCCVYSANAGFGRRPLLGGFSSIDVDKVKELSFYKNVVTSVKQHVSQKLGSGVDETSVKLKCSERQLVNGLGYQVYFSSNGLQCQAKFYTDFYGHLQSRINVQCDKELAGYQNCQPTNNNRRHRRSLDEPQHHSNVVNMEKEAGKSGEVQHLFNLFNFHYNRTYSSTDVKKFNQKLKVFAENWSLIQQLNRLEKGSAIYGMTKFMDYTTEEFKKYFTPGFSKQLVETPKLANVDHLEAMNFPESVDWRKKGGVTPVKNQGQCGSCWAFSVTGNVEGQWFLKTGKLLSLSEQELVDCDSLDDGCQGGLPVNAYKSIEKLGGLETEADYPYDGRGESCSINKSKLNVYVNDSVVLPTDEKKIAKWIASHGPVSIGINANLMQFYFGGIAHPWKIFCNPKSLDHGVLIVGYGTEDGKPYWIIKNSWGPDWGEEGYYRIYRGDGSCGVNQMVSSAIIN